MGAVGDRNFTNSCGPTRSGSSKQTAESDTGIRITNIEGNTSLGDCGARGNTTELWAALQMVLMLEDVEYQMKEAAN
jgi:hypothetical protein